LEPASETISFTFLSKLNNHHQNNLKKNKTIKNDGCSNKNKKNNNNVHRLSSVNNKANKNLSIVGGGIGKKTYSEYSESSIYPHKQKDNNDNEIVGMFSENIDKSITSIAEPYSESAYFKDKT
jgi:hypothetical protein